MANEKVARFLRGLNIKTVQFGGFDKQATFEALKQLALIYEDLLSEQRETFRNQMETQPVASAGTDDRVRLLTEAERQKDGEIRRLDNEVRQKDGEVRRLQAELAAARRQKPADRSAYDAKAKELQQVLTLLRQRKDKWEQDARAQTEKLLCDARKEAEGIVQDAQLEALRQKNSAQQEVDALKTGRAAIRREIQLAEEQMKPLLRTVNGWEL